MKYTQHEEKKTSVNKIKYKYKYNKVKNTSTVQENY